MTTLSNNESKVGFSPSTLVELLRWRASRDADRVAYIYLADGETEEARLTYADLDRGARAVGAHLQDLGAQGQRVLLLYPPGLDYITAFFGCLYAGAIAVPAYPPRPNRTLERLQGIMAEAGISLTLTTESIAAKIVASLGELLPRGLRWQATDNLAEGLADGWREYSPEPETLAFLQYTSGSTAAPKGVMVSHGNLVHNQSLIRHAFKQTEESIVVGWLPLYHDMGLIGNVIQSLYVGARAILMSPAAFLQRPSRWLEAISRYRATTTGGPSFAYDLCVKRITSDQKATLDLSAWSVAFNGSEPIRAETLDKFSDAFASCGFRREAFFPCYGLAEATLFVSGGPPEAAPVIARVQSRALKETSTITEAGTDETGASLVGCGRISPQQTVIIVDPETLVEAPPNRIGEIWVAGPSITQGYWNRPEATEETFNGRLADTGEGPFLRTGDLGFIRDGELFVTGRIKDLIIIRGVNHYPQDIELTAERSHSALRAGCGAAFSVEVEGEERLVVVHELDPRRPHDTREVIENIRQSVAENHELQVHAVTLIKAGTLLKTSSGKIQRRACRAAFLKGRLECIAEWKVGSTSSEAPTTRYAAKGLLNSVEAIKGWLAFQVAPKLGIDPFKMDLDQPLTRYGLDSLTSVELTHLIETTIGVEIPLSSLLQGASIAGVAAQIQDSLNRPAATISISSSNGERDTGAFPLSKGQLGLWFLHKADPDGAAYNVAGAVRILSELDIDAFRRALAGLLARHEMLRAVFEEVNTEVLQRTDGNRELDFQLYDASEWSDEELRRRLSIERQQRFDLTQGPLFRVRLYTRNKREHALLIVAHHIVVDMWSLCVLVSELGKLYGEERGAGKAELECRVANYRDFVRLESDILGTKEGRTSRDYWLAELGGELPVLELWPDRPRPPAQTCRGGAVRFNGTAAITERLRELCKREGVTINMGLLAAYNALLHRYSDQSDLVVGTATSGRTRRELAGAVGYFVNPIAIRSSVSSQDTFKDLLRKVRDKLASGIEHQRYPFNQIVEELRSERDQSRNPVFQTVFVFQKSPVEECRGLEALAVGEEGARFRAGELEFESIELEERTSQFDLTLMMTEIDGELRGSFQYNSDLFDEKRVRRMAEHFQRLLEGLVSEPDRRVSRLTLLGADEEEEILRTWNRTERAYERDSCVHRLVEDQANLRPDAVAVHFETEHVTYAGLNRKANQLAAYLRQLGVGPEAIVAVCLDRSVDMVVALLGVLKARAAYLPLDPAYPSSRLSFMCADARAIVLITQDRLAGNFVDYQGTVVLLEEEQQAIALHPDRNPEELANAENLAYVIYTSGSTGQPKGVQISHRSLMNLVRWHQEEFAIAEDERATQIAGVGFDAAVWELWPYLTAGASIHVPNETVRQDPEHLQCWLQVNQITICFLPTPVGELLMRLGWPDTSSLRSLLVGGDKLTSLPVGLPFVVVNNYGPTEGTVVSTSGPVDEEVQANDAPSIGKPIGNVQVYILGESMEPVPAGVAGELCVGGAGLARDYLNRPDLTAEKFLPNSFSANEGERLYRTGDLARFNPEGVIEFLGRIDQQVKVRGFRVELGEIEAALSSHEAVSLAVVVVTGAKSAEKRLIAYVVLREGTNFASLDLREFLKDKLPDYMIPAWIEPLQDLPLTANGKVDRERLPQVEIRTADLEKPSTVVEEVLAAIWENVLGLDRVGVRDNFFELGGHSLLATQVASRVRETFGVDIGVRKVFEEPTVSGLAEAIEQLRSGGNSTPATEPISRHPRQGNLPPSFAQQRMWFLNQMLPDSSAYNIFGAVRLIGPLSIEVLEQSIREVVRRHEVLRTSYQEIDGQIAQVIADQPELQISIADLSAEPAPELKLKVLEQEESHRPFDLRRGPVLRATVLTVAHNHHVLFFNMHHVAGDGWSMGVLVSEVGKLYQAFSSGTPSPLAELDIQYADYAISQKQLFDGEQTTKQLGYWKQRLGSSTDVLELPTDRPRPPVQSFVGGQVELQLNHRTANRLKNFSRGERASLFMSLLAALKVVLSRYTGQHEIRVGTAIAGRARKELEGLIGFFVNTLVLSSHISPDATYRELVRAERDVVLEGHANQDLPFEKLVEEVQPERSLSHTPLFQVMMVMQNAPSAALNIDGVAAQELKRNEGIAKFDLTLDLAEVDGTIAGRIDYNAELFDHDRITRIASHLVNLVENALDNPDAPIWTIDMLSEEEKTRIVDDWNRTERDWPELDQNVVEVIEKVVGDSPDRIALGFEGQQLTYAEFNRKANQLANYLKKEGVRPESIVGVLLDRSLEMVVALAGVLKAGGCYLPLDPAYPSHRIAFMLEDANARVLLTNSELSDRLGDYEGRIVRLDAQRPEIGLCCSENPEVLACGENLAYVIYTSGSTGLPKGVQISHRSLMNLISWHHDEFEITERVRATQIAGVGFDAAVWELWPYLTAGASIHIPTETVKQDPDQLMSWLLLNDITICFLPTPLGEMLIKLDWPDVTSLATLLVGGDKLSFFPTALPFELVNNYGPTEGTVVSTSGIVENVGLTSVSDAPSIGRPIANVRVFILDRNMQPAPAGVAGELFVGGEGLARDYLNRPDLTAEKFIPDSFSARQGARLYRTGDLARFNSKGTIEFLRRIDQQVKIRGFRVELGEIESALSSHDAVSLAVAVLSGDQSAEKRLIAYVVLREGANSSILELRDFLTNRLPDYMVPSWIELLEELPLTPNGKVDRSRLPKVEIRSPDLNDNPTSVVEEVLSLIWQDVLGLDQLGIHDNFFELGGHSLLATQVASRVRETFGVDIGVRKVFEEPTVSGLAEAIEQLRSGGNSKPATEPIFRHPPQGKLPLSFAQQRMWFLNQMLPDSSAYNIFGVVSLLGDLSIEILEQSIREVVRRHEILRTTYQEIDDDVVQVIEDHPQIEIPVADLRGEPNLEIKIKLLERQEISRPFNLSRGPVLRATILRVADDHHFLFFTIHHIAGDGWSIRVLVSEVGKIYEAFRSGAPSHLADLDIQYSDYAIWQRHHFDGERAEKQLTFWKERLGNSPGLLELPTDRPRPPVQSFIGGEVRLQFSQPTTAKLKSFSQTEHASLFMSLLAGFKVVLSRYTGQDEIRVGTPIAGRTTKQLEGLIGFFVNTLVLSSQISPLSSFRHLVREEREVVLEGHANQDLPFEKLVEELQPQRSLSHSPLFQVMMVMQDAPRDLLNIRGLLAHEHKKNDDVAQFDLTLELAEDAGALRGRIEYNAELFSHDRIARMATHFINLIENALDNPDAPVWTLDILTEHERSLIVDHWNRTQHHWDLSHDNLVDHIESVVRECPDRIALEFEGEQLTYHEFNKKANQLANYLRNDGVNPESIVGVLLDRSVELVVALAAILKAGAAYLPLDPAYPSQRIAFMLEDANASIVLTQDKFFDILSKEVRAISLNKDWDIVGAEAEVNPVRETTPENLAYVIYTSGSTGQPKGAMNSHKGLVNRLLWMQDRYRLTPADRVLQKTPYTFDVSVWEFFWPLMVGARLVVARPGGHQDSSYLVDLIARAGISVLHFVPPMLQVFLEEERVENCDSLRCVVCSGEALPPQLTERFFSRLNAELHNLYGPTEASIDVTSWACDRSNDSGVVPIGAPIANTQIYLVNRQMQPAPIGVPGELMIGGAGLGRGYLGRPDMTAEKFIPNPFAFEPGARVYKTGDSARHMPDGNVEFLGRLDHQVKIRGLRVELGEIEAAIAAHEGVREALVTLRQDETGDKRLVGYLVPCNGGLGDLSGLKDHLKKSLPQHMVPSAFVTLDQFPLTSNGKIDRKSLPPPAGVLRDGAGFVAPRNQIERSIANVWQQVLGIDRVGIHDNFFDLGGHSLLVIQSRAKLRSAINREVAITDLFQYPTVSSLARYLSGSGEDQLGLSRISARAGNRRTMTRRRRRSNSPIEDGQEPKNESISSPSLAWTPTNASLSEEREQVEGRNS